MDAATSKTARPFWILVSDSTTQKRRRTRHPKSQNVVGGVGGARRVFVRTTHLRAVRVREEFLNSNRDDCEKLMLAIDSAPNTLSPPGSSPATPPSFMSPPLTTSTINHHCNEATRRSEGRLHFHRVALSILHYKSTSEPCQHQHPYPPPLPRR